MYTNSEGESPYMDAETAICTCLSQSPRIFEAFVADIPADMLDISRRSGFWTLRDHITHLADVQPMLHDRIVLFRDSESPEIVPYFPDEETEAATPGPARMMCRLTSPFRSSASGEEGRLS
jgi:hypothetical protein